MAEWKEKPGFDFGEWDITDEHGRKLFAVCGDENKVRDIVRQVIREHNAHEELVRMVVEFGRQICDSLDSAVAMCKSTDTDEMERKCAGVAATKFRELLKYIDAVLTKAEGNQDNAVR